jgi:hypothetical protein
MDMPPMGMDPMMGEPPMGDPSQTGMPQDMPMGDDMNYGADFDAGVDADENTDPKKYIQQLTGKLSQILRKYNQSLPQPDADLDKYVAGMIVKQAIEGLPQEDVSEILDKVNSGEPMQEPDAQMEQPQMNGEMPQDAGQGMEMPQQPNESKNRHGINIDELLIKNLDNDSEKEMYHKSGKSGSYRKKAFTSPQFN